MTSLGWWREKPQRALSVSLDFFLPSFPFFSILFPPWILSWITCSASSPLCGCGRAEGPVMHSSMALNPSECLLIKALSGLCWSYKRHAYLKATSPQDFSNMLLESDLYGVLRTSADMDALGGWLTVVWASTYSLWTHSSWGYCN